MLAMAPTNETAIFGERSSNIGTDAVGCSDDFGLQSLSIGGRDPLSPNASDRRNDELSYSDCSSSVSSQNECCHSNDTTTASNSTNNTHTRNSPGRSVFSGYWERTGQKPIPIRSMRSLKGFDSSQSPAAHPASSSMASPSTPRGYSSSRSRYPHDVSLHPSVSDVDLLEEDDVVPTGIHSDAMARSPVPSHSQSHERRRRSILPVAPLSHPALRTTKTRRSCRKSASLPCVDVHVHAHHRLLVSTDMARSLPRMISGPFTPRASCLRPFQKYSPNRNDSSRSNATATTCTADSSGSSSAASSFSSTDSMQMPLRPGDDDSVLWRPQMTCSSSSSLVSVTSSVSFLDAVDVRHFEKPRETYAQKGWSDYFK